MKLTGEMPVPSLSTESPEQDANVNEYYEYCLERMKSRGCIISLRTTPGMIMYRWIVSHAKFHKSQTAVLLFIQ